MADDTAAVRKPKITDMPSGEAYAFLLRQITLYGEYTLRAENAHCRGLTDRAARMSDRRQLMYQQICQDVYTLTIGAPVWETQP